MDCEAVEDLLDLKDASRRPDPAALTAHVTSCPRCRGRHPDAAFLLVGSRGRAAPRTPAWRRPTPHRRTRLLRTAALLGALLVGGVVAHRALREEAPPPEPPATGSRAAHVRPQRSELVNAFVSIQRDRRLESTIVHRVWSPPPPRCLLKEE